MQSFDMAKQRALSRPSVILINELDLIAPSRVESKGSSSVVAELLVLMDGLVDRGNVIVIATTSQLNSIDSALRRPGRFDREVEIVTPDILKRQMILKSNLPIVHSVDIDHVASITNGFTLHDLENLVRDTLLISLSQNCIPSMPQILTAMKEANGPSISRSTKQIPKMSWDSIAGLDTVKERIQTMVLKPILHAEKLRLFGLPAPQGILFYGPPGCSKTTIAKAMASTSGFSFHALNSAQIYSSAVGASESKIREVFKVARQTSPSFLFFDELDALVSNRSNTTGDSVQDRVLSTLLNEMDGITTNHGVVVLVNCDN
jgi:transitional endoplasmic reticulum ATPase